MEFDACRTLVFLLCFLVQPFDRAMSIGCFAEVAEELGTHRIHVFVLRLAIDLLDASSCLP
jgi:hypothetical protein